MPQADIEALIVAKVREGKHVVRLKGGDPFVFGRGAEEAQTLARRGDCLRNRSRNQFRDRRARVRRHSGDAPACKRAFTVATGHEDPAKAASTLDWAKLADPHRTLVFLMAMGTSTTIARSSIASTACAGTTPAAVIQDGTRPTQRTRRRHARNDSAAVTRAGLGAPAIVVIGDVVDAARGHCAGSMQRRSSANACSSRVRRDQAEAFAQALLGARRGTDSGPDDRDRAARRPACRRIARSTSSRRIAWVVFTSANGVDAFFDRLTSLDADARYLGEHESRRDRRQNCANVCAAMGCAPTSSPTNSSAKKRPAR